MDTEKIQILLFQEIREKTPKHISLADSVAALLEISPDSAYRRIRGEKPISLEELQKLSVHYNLSLDRLLNPSGKSFLFNGDLLDESNYDIEQWLAQLNQMTQSIKKQSDVHVYYIAKDVPFIYPLQFPVLAAFKDFFRKKYLAPRTHARGSKFSTADQDLAVNALSNQIVNAYNTIASTEIWSSESFNSIIKQIQFYHYTGQFASEKDRFVLFDTLETMINHLEHQAEIGIKYKFGEKPEKDAAGYNLYNNELFIGEDTILADLGDAKITFLNHSFINYMTTSDQLFCNYTFRNIKTIIARSTPVSWAGEKDRRIFFNSLKKKLDDARSSR
ncbi:helix-turn-helix domain-containing protein [Dyadobacter sp. CY323]|uniref:helix-turn-helix domain-containing protein n=1 Tax=Dyadobacter sp. CY323 TaxID=2907302 RepID=UPI001F458D18|nr:helix-turn-helix domain-containing protein [Dyadobacter sp. CY323]MCE6989433.1 hypothetical protein [Dyadobacter sp. CY323]